MDVHVKNVVQLVKKEIILELLNVIGMNLKFVFHIIEKDVILKKYQHFVELKNVVDLNIMEIQKFNK